MFEMKSLSAFWWHLENHVLEKQILREYVNAGPLSIFLTIVQLRNT